MKTLIFIPCRKGSQTIKDKNMQLLGGMPLWELAYQNARAVQNCDPHNISLAFSSDYNFRHFENTIKPKYFTARPRAYADGKTHSIAEVCLDFIDRSMQHYDIVLLLQPTSPFVNPNIAWQAIKTFDSPKFFADLASIQTIAEVGHNSHHVNQRMDNTLGVQFLFPDMRKRAWNKQRKQTAYTFGNFVVTRVDELRKQKTFFAEPSMGMKIDRAEAWDIDDQLDLNIANAMVKEGIVRL